MAINDKDLEDYEKFLNIYSSKEPILNQSEINNFIPPDESYPESGFIEQPATRKHGGPNRGQGRKPKPPEAKYRHRLITLPPALDDRLIKWSIESGREISPMIAELVDKFLISQAPH